MKSHVMMAPFEENVCGRKKTGRHSHLVWVCAAPGDPLKPVGVITEEVVCSKCWQIVHDLVIAKEAGIEMEGVV